MTDVHDKLTRSYNMSRVKAKNTKPELLVRSFLHSNGFRFRLHDPRLPGRPDIVMKKFQTVILVQGCFWHGHSGCKYFVLPKTRAEWWKDKINSTKIKDEKNTEALIELRWNVIIVWECELKPLVREQTFKYILNTLVRY